MRSRTEEELVAAWLRLLQSAYSFAVAEALRKLRGERYSFLDGRGIHPFSEVMGEIRWIEGEAPWLSELWGSANPYSIRRAAAEDARVIFAREVLEAHDGSLASTT